MLEYSVALLMTFLLSWKVLFRHGFDVIHAANPPDFFFLVGLLYRVLGKKFIFDQHDLSPELIQVKFPGRSRLLYRFLCLLERCSYQTAHVTITTNVSQKRFAIERGHRRPGQVFVVRNGPDLRRLTPVPPEPALRQGRNHVLVYVGEMEVQDGIDYALRALQSLVYQHGREDVLLVLVGDGGYAPTLRKLAHELQLDAYVHFTGWLDTHDLLRYLSVADVGLVPDPKNGLNEYCTMVKTMEYMALGLPIVAFDLPETRFSAEDAALYAAPNCIEDFAHNIDALLNDDALRLAMSVAGRRRVEEGMSWDNDRQVLLRAYQYCRNK
jgi:glycosyltransferase involved in cell wall biosynthesis